MHEVRIGVIGTENTHAHVACALINGWDQRHPIPTQISDNPHVGPGMYRWALQVREFEIDSPTRVPIPDARVTRIWSSLTLDAKRIADACGIDFVCSSPDEACQDVDAVLVLSEDPALHWAHAAPALQKGLCTFIDNPLADTIEVCEKIEEFAAAHDAPWFSGSAARWSPELRLVRQVASDRVGPLIGVTVQCPNGLHLYGPHALEIANACLGLDVECVHAIRVRGRETTMLKYRDGCTALLDNIHGMKYPSFHVVLYGTKGHWYVEIRDLVTPFLDMLERFVSMARGGPNPIAADERIAVTRLLHAAEYSIVHARPVALQEVG